jgi:hypothetical protein
VEELGGSQRRLKLRASSNQDIKPPSARASLTIPQKHKAAASYPIYPPSSPQGGYSSTPPFLPWGLTHEMDVPRLVPRTSSISSVASSVTSQSSFESRFESRNRSPLSIASSVDFSSSEDWAYQDPTKNGILVTETSVLPRKTPIEANVQRYATGSEGRKQRSSLPKVGPGPARQRPKRPTSRIPGEGFSKLPEEILHVIIEELKNLHLCVGSSSCSTCWMRDLVSLGISCTKWWGAVRSVLYEDIQLVGCDSVLHTKKKYKLKYGTRLTLLRRTLRARPGLASYVKSLKVPALPESVKFQGEREEYLDLVASLVMACPNLEKLPGFYQPYNHEFSRLVSSLSTRKRLTEMVWIINASPFQRQHRYEIMKDSDFFTPVLAPSPLLPEQCHNFLAYHDQWSNLQTLFLHCNPGGTIDAALFPNLLWSLPSLENLYVSSFPAPSFNDSTLLALPSLKTLRLENLPGITAAGLSAYPSSRRTDSLTSLSLISIPLLSLPVLARMFAHLKALTRFTISQAPSLSLPVGTDIFLHPYLASRTLQYLHWEFTDAEDDIATNIIAKAIVFGGFPALRTIRAPTDHDGTLQKLCRPRRQIELSSDRYRNIVPTFHSGISNPKTTTTIPSPTKPSFPGHGYSSSVSYSNAIKSPTRSAFSLNLDGRSSNSGDSIQRDKGTSLATARVMAQNRMEAATAHPKFHIIVWDENGEFIERFAVGGFMGIVESKINYSLKPDVDGSDEAIVGIDGRLGLLDNIEDNPRDGCIGAWNSTRRAQAKVSRQKDEWLHTERKRWKELELRTFF